jgi:glycosyltransferase involved in cell wall biosynthesis
MPARQDLRPRHGLRLLIITNETIGPRMSGPGIRSWEMACALSEKCDVTLAVLGKPARQHPSLRVVGCEIDEPHCSSLESCIADADVVLGMGSLFARMPRTRNLNKPAIVDLYDPFELEKLAQSPVIPEEHWLKIDTESIIHLQFQGAVGDFFICASERQRDFWLGTLLAAGRVNAITYTQDPTLRKLIDVVPFGIPSEPPRKRQDVLKGVHPGIRPNDKVLFWNGGLWQWFDPLTLINALVEVLRVRDDVKLFFAAGRHFNLNTVPEMPIYEQTLARCREMDLLDRHVFFGDWIPYDERGDYLLEADLGVSVHKQTLESRFASRTRLLDCVWTGLPVISTAGDPLSEMIVQYELGQTIPPERPDLLAEAILSMLADDGLRDRVTGNAQAIRDELTWTQVVEPIARFLERASFAPDALIAAKIANLNRLAELELRVQNLERHLSEVRQGRVMRVLNAASRWLSTLKGQR